MTGKADAFSVFARQAEFEVAAVRAVALYATVCNRGVNKFFFGKLILLVVMAGIADIISFGHEHFWKIRRMWGMADAASVSRYRPMDKLASTDAFIMTFVTKIGTCTFELELIGGLVRAMAACTVTVCYWLMDNRASAEFFMAFVTEGFNILNGLKFVFVLVVLLMAEGAVTCGNWAMYIFIFSHSRMAFGCDA